MPVFSTVRLGFKSERNLVHAADVFRPDLILGEGAEGAQNVQLFLVIVCQLLRDGAFSADGEIAPLHESEAPGGTPSKVLDPHVPGYGHRHEADGVGGDPSTGRRVLVNPLPKFILQLWPFGFVPSETLSGRLSLAQVVFLLPPPAHHRFGNIKLSRRGSVPVDDCVADSHEFKTRLVSTSSPDRCHFGVPRNAPQNYAEVQHVLLREAPNYGGPEGPIFHRATRGRSLLKYHKKHLTDFFWRRFEGSKHNRNQYT